MKKTIAVLTATLFGLFVMAQPPMPGKRGNFTQGKENRGRQGMGNLLKNIELTEGQKKQVQQLQKEHRETMKTLMQNEQQTVKEQRDKLFDLSKAHKNQIDALLTPAQREQVKAAMNLQKARMEAKRAQGFERMSTRLKLSAEQQEAMKQEQVKMKSTIEAIRADKNADRSALQQKMKQAMENHKKAIASILTEKQKKEMEIMQENRPGNNRPMGPQGGRKGHRMHPGAGAR